MELKLDAAKWRRIRGIKRLLAALGAEEGLTRYVGGAVRDGLLGLPVNDVDLATRLKPQEVIARLEKAKIKAVPTGLDHGTITAVSDGHPFEITTLRTDVETDGRRATVAFPDDWKADGWDLILATANCWTAISAGARSMRCRLLSPRTA